MMNKWKQIKNNIEHISLAYFYACNAKTKNQQHKLASGRTKTTYNVFESEDKVKFTLISKCEERTTQ